MPKLPISQFREVDIAPTARNWVADEDGAWRRMGCHSDAMLEIQRAINNLLAWHHRPVLSQAWRVLDAVAHRGSAPLLRFMVPDKIRNARSRSTVMLGITPANTAGTGFFYAGSEANSEWVTPWWTQNHAGAQTEGDFSKVYSTGYYESRGARTDADLQIGMNCYNEMTVVGVCQYDDFIHKLDTSVHEYCDPGTVGRGEKILDDALDDARRTFHRVRSENLPIVMQWSAIGASHRPAAPGNCAAITVDTNFEEGIVNLFDQSTVNTADDLSVGACTDAWRAGVGPEWSDEGRKVAVTVRVYGQTVGADNSYGTVTFIGPSGISDNNTSVNVFNELAWYGTDAKLVYLDAQQSGDEVTAAGNRIHAFGGVQNTGVPMYIYGVRAWMHWPYGTE